MTKPSFGTRLTLLLASSLTVMATVTIAPALPEISSRFSARDPTGVWTRLLLTSPGLSIAISAIPAGWLVDRVGRQRPLIVACLVYAAAGSAGLWLESLPALLISRILLGFSVAVIMMAATALVADWFVGHERERFLGLQSASMAFGGVVFLTLGGLLAGWTWRAPFGIYLFGLAVLLLAVSTLHWSRPPAADSNVKISGQAEAPLRPDPVSDLVIYGLAGLVFLVLFQVHAQLPFLLDRLGIAPGPLTGLVLATTSLFGAAVALCYQTGKARLSFPGVMSFSFSWMAIGFVIIALAPSWPGVWVGAAVAGAGWGWTMPNLNVWLLAGVAPGGRGRALGWLMTSVFAGQFAAPLAAQPLIAARGVDAVFWAAAGILVLTAVALRSVPRWEPQPRASHRVEIATSEPRTRYER
jgi:MFS family permease